MYEIGKEIESCATPILDRKCVGRSLHHSCVVYLIQPFTLCWLLSMLTGHLHIPITSKHTQFCALKIYVRDYFIPKFRIAFCLFCVCVFCLLVCLCTI